jgi:hypothetical protein
LEVYRKNPIPAIYYYIPWIRKSPNAQWADCSEDLELIHQMKNVCTGKLCLSSFDGGCDFLIKAIFPNDWNQYDGTTWESITWKYYKWNVWNVLYYIHNNEPNEAVPLHDAGISIGYLENIVKPVSCIPILKELKKTLDYSELTDSDIEEIKKKEINILSEVKLRKMKGSALNYIENDKKKNGRVNISPKLRKEVLQRDNYKCVFCGATANDAKIEVDHIIPISIINELFLDVNLYEDKSNLCATCENCNRGKSDYISVKDIEYYIGIFSSVEHPNYAISRYLVKIRELQDL